MVLSNLLSVCGARGRGLGSAAILVALLLAQDETRAEGTKPLLLKGKHVFSALDGSEHDGDGEPNGVLVIKRLVLDHDAKLLIDIPSARIASDTSIEMERRAEIRGSAGGADIGVSVTLDAVHDVRVRSGARIRLDGNAQGGELIVVAGGDIRFGPSTKVRANASSEFSSGGSIRFRAKKNVIFFGDNSIEAHGGEGGVIRIAACGAGDSAFAANHGVLELLCYGHNGRGGEIGIEARAGGADLKAAKHRFEAIGASGDGSIRLAAAAKFKKGSLTAVPEASLVNLATFAFGCDVDVPDASVPAFAIDITASPQSIAPGQSVHLTASCFSDSVSIASWNWEFGDGTIAAGSEVDKIFTKAGLHFVSVSAIDALGRGVEDGVAIMVAPAPGETVGPFGIRMAALPGDVDLDGAITVRDALRLAQHVGELELLTASEALLAADIDLDGDVDTFDANLVAEAVARGSTLPDRLLEVSGQPGRVVRIISSHLLDPGVDAFVIVNSHATPVFRRWPGYGAFLVPFDAAAGPSTLDLVLGGAPVAQYPFTIDPPFQTSNPIGEDLKTALAMLGSIHQNLVDAYEPYLELIGASDEEKLVVRSLLTVAEDGYSKLDVPMMAAIEALPPGELALMERIANANGLQELLAEQALLFSKAAPGDEILAIVCDASAYANLALSGTSFVSTACDVAVIAAAVLTAGTSGGASPALLAVVSACAYGSAPLAVAAAGAELITEYSQSSLQLEAEPTVLNSEQPVAELRTSVRFHKLIELCATPGNQLEEKLTALAAKHLLQKAVGLKWLYKILKELPEKVGKPILEKVESIVQKALQSGIDDSFVDDKLKEVQFKICQKFGIDGTLAKAPIDPHGVLGLPQPNVGVLTMPPSGTGDPATYAPPTDLSTVPDGKVKFTATKKLCGTEQSQSVTVTVGSKQVTITMGDNGSLLDDIFLVEVDGQTVLTSSAPVTAAAKTVTLAFGEHTVVMKGLAAPDGIGTYYIHFSGATVVSGPALSGSDLTPGVTKTWKLSVP